MSHEATCDILIVGAGYSGLVMAERFSTRLGLKSIVIDRRSHIGGNSYDYHDEAGVLLHKYGPHYFRTDAPHVREYLSRFTEWHPVEYKIKSYARGRYWSFPINLNTFEEFLGRPSSTEEMESYLEKKRVPIAEPANSEEAILAQVGWELYELFYKGYTLKQWKRHPCELDASVCRRVPIRTNRDDRYLREEFQALPKHGYTEMFKAMVAQTAHSEIWLSTHLKDVRNKVRHRHMIYTGPVDQYFDYRFGPLPYRSLRFEPETFTKEQLFPRLAIAGKPGFWQPALQVNYPNDETFTRIVELKHATGQDIDATTVVREYPHDFAVGEEPYYPVPMPESQRQYQQYAELARAEKNVTFLGRLATYRYFNMDQVVAKALAEFERLSAADWSR